MRDAQRQKLYDAELSWRRTLDAHRPGSHAEHAPGGVHEIKFATLEEAQDYADFVCKRERLSRVRIEPRKDGAKFTSIFHATSKSAFIRMPTWGMRETVLLHELAHHAADDHMLPSHGVHFANRFAEMVGRHMSQDAEDQLRASYDVHGVRHRPAREYKRIAKYAREIVAGRHGPERMVWVLVAREDQRPLRLLRKLQDVQGSGRTTALVLRREYEESTHLVLARDVMALGKA